MSMSKREQRAQRQAEREAQHETQREAAQRRQRNKRVFNYAIALLVLAGIGAALFFASRADEGPGQYDALAQCLTDAGVVMYGTEWCPHCKAQKELFGNSFRLINYVDCDRSKPACDAAGVEGYPTWTFPGNESLAGQQPLAVLAERAQCPLNMTRLAP